MGIDVYLTWKNMTPAEKEKQSSYSFSIEGGEAGYLREAYHGGPYATHILVREAFEEADDEPVAIPAAVMRERMTHVTEPARGCDAGSHIAAAFNRCAQQIVERAAAKTEEDTPDVILQSFSNIAQAAMDELQNPDNNRPPETEPMSVTEAIHSRGYNIYGHSNPEDYIKKSLTSFEAFVALAERKEKETGEPCQILASW